jgi:hypothetical protein
LVYALGAASDEQHAPTGHPTQSLSHPYNCVPVHPHRHRFQLWRVGKVPKDRLKGLLGGWKQQGRVHNEDRGRKRCRDVSHQKNQCRYVFNTKLLLMVYFPLLLWWAHCAGWERGNRQKVHRLGERSQVGSPRLTSHALSTSIDYPFSSMLEPCACGGRWEGWSNVSGAEEEGEDSG